MTPHFIHQHSITSSSLELDNHLFHQSRPKNGLTTFVLFVSSWVSSSAGGIQKLVRAANQIETEPNQKNQVRLDKASMSSNWFVQKMDWFKSIRSSRSNWIDFKMVKFGSKSIQTESNLFWNLVWLKPVQTEPSWF